MNTHEEKKDDILVKEETTSNISSETSIEDVISLDTEESLQNNEEIKIETPLNTAVKEDTVVDSLSAVEAETEAKTEEISQEPAQETNEEQVLSSTLDDKEDKVEEPSAIIEEVSIDKEEARIEEEIHTHEENFNEVENTSSLLEEQPISSEVSSEAKIIADENIDENTSETSNEELLLDEATVSEVEEAKSEKTIHNEVKNEVKVEATPIEPNSAESFSFGSKLLGFISLLVLVCITCGFFFIGNAELRFPFEGQLLTALKYMQETGSYLVPTLAENSYIQAYPLPYWLVSALMMLELPISLTLTDSFAVVLSLSVVLFAISCYSLALSVRVSSRAALSSSCIALATFFVFVFSPSISTHLLFASFVNFSLIFFYRAWIKKFSPILMLFAFFFMALALFTNGFFAFAFPIITSIVFLILQGHFRRINDGDGIFAFLCFLLLIAGLYTLAYMEGTSAYIMQLFDFETLKSSWTSWFYFEHILYYALLAVLLFMPFLIIPFLVSWKKGETSGFARYKQGRFSYYEKLEIQRLVDKENNEKSETARQMYDDYRRSSGSIFLFSALIGGVFTLLLFPQSSVSYIYALAPAASILLARNLMSFGAIKTKVFSIYLGIIVLLYGAISVIIFMLPQIEILYPEYLALFPRNIVENLLSIPQLSFLSIPLAVLAICVFLMKKHYPQKVLYFFTVALILIVGGVQTLFIPSLEASLPSEAVEIVEAKEEEAKAELEKIEEPTKIEEKTEEATQESVQSEPTQNESTQDEAAQEEPVQEEPAQPVGTEPQAEEPAEPLADSNESTNPTIVNEENQTQEELTPTSELTEIKE